MLILGAQRTAGFFLVGFADQIGLDGGAAIHLLYMAASGASSLTGGAFKLFASASGQQQEQAAATIQEKAQQLQQKAPELQQKAQEAKPQATKAAWITFGSLILSLLAALIGSAAGRRRHPVQPTSRGT